MTERLKVAFISTEFAPFAKSGELADVAGSLPKYLSAQGLEVSVFLPKYRLPEMESLTGEIVLDDLTVPLGGTKVKARVFKSDLGKTDLFLVDHPSYFWRDGIYGSGLGEYLDNDERFIFFNRAVLEALLHLNERIDVIHCNSWHTALIPVFLKTHYSSKKLFKDTATVLTLHNVTYQGEFPPESLKLTDLNWSYFTPSGLALNGRFNFLKAGIMFSDRINTVSAAYRREILTERYGLGLEKILESRRSDFKSIRNGVDNDVWNPEKDPYLAANYSAADLRMKKECKRDLLGELGLEEAMDSPILGVVSYLTKHKGLDILLDSIDELMIRGVGLVVLGQGDEAYESRLQFFQKRYPGRIAVRLGMNEGLAHRIFAGADMFLMPSLYEPCGLNHLYALRYGTVPIVRATGGLLETVRPYDGPGRNGNGFLFKEYESESLVGAVQEALDMYHRPEEWKKIVKIGLRDNYSWDKAAKRYVKFYKEAIQSKRGG